MQTPFPVIPPPPPQFPPGYPGPTTPLGFAKSFIAAIVALAIIWLLLDILWDPHVWAQRWHRWIGWRFK